MLQVNASGRDHFQCFASGQWPQPDGLETPGRFGDPSRPEGDSYGASVDRMVYPEPFDNVGFDVQGETSSLEQFRHDPELLRIRAFQHSDTHRGVHGRDEDTLSIGATTCGGITPKDVGSRQKAVNLVHSIPIGGE